MEDMHTSYGLTLTYNKAWRSREKALMAVRGTVEDSYDELPSYLLQKKNPGTITDIQTDEKGHFMYMFISLGVSIRGFIGCCRPVLCIDASFLKHKVGGQLLVAIALNANEQLYPVAFGVVDSENNNSWTYFMQQLRLAIVSFPDLVFISDRHPNCHVEFDLASRAYTESTFQKHFDKIRTKDPRIAEYLEQIGVERWSRAFLSGSRYNQMTSFTQLNRGAWHMRRHVIQFFIIMKLGTFPNISRNESA
ncbi:uncharacterized protein LOC124941602 [Impatiens glandulifera]|uniref:uncharacterized protein LOC124941602 n=1 Tax=Impatiens glandulifera TaxID=253017 RepID=UPI001FB0AFD9|nr:uncharacterized protein LOC124941602 [Impatiens glandulifera]